jgi:hypothetical protein
MLSPKMATGVPCKRAAAQPLPRGHGVADADHVAAARIDGLLVGGGPLSLGDPASDLQRQFTGARQLV